LWIFAAATIIFAAGNVIISLRWWLLLKTQSIFIELRAAVMLFFLGWFYNNFMPSSVGGDLVRAWYVTKHTDKKFNAALSVFVDRGIGLAGTLIIAAFYYLFFFRHQVQGGGLLVSYSRRGISSGVCVTLKRQDVVAKDLVAYPNIWAEDN
jgi:uncharacterized protein (TIRG00374 family)